MWREKGNLKEYATAADMQITLPRIKVVQRVGKPATNTMEKTILEKCAKPEEPERDNVKCFDSEQAFVVNENSNSGRGVDLLYKNLSQWEGLTYWC